MFAAGEQCCGEKFVRTAVGREKVLNPFIFPVRVKTTNRKLMGLNFQCGVSARL